MPMTTIVIGFLFLVLLVLVVTSSIRMAREYERGDHGESSRV
jgi:regulator of protease activity HflC (stomatin/prohibitin superfamily)